MALGKLQNLAFRKTASGATVVSFKVVDDDGVAQTLGAAAHLLPWEQYKGLPEEVGFEAGQLYAITSQLDVMMQTRRIGEDEDWSIECLYKPKDTSRSAEVEALKRIPNMLQEAGVISYPDALEFMQGVQANCGRASDMAVGK